MLQIIFGYNQKQIIDYGLEVKHLIILDYVRTTLADPKLPHLYVDGYLYTGIPQQKILDDLPILEYGLYHLRHVLADLVKLDMLKTKSYANEGLKGSKTYYSLTEKYWQLVYTDQKVTERLKMVTDNDQELKKASQETDQVPKMNQQAETPYLCEDSASGAKKSSSSPPSNPLISYPSKTDKHSIREQAKESTVRAQGQDEKKVQNRKPKMDLHSKCVRYIMKYTDYFKLQKALVRYLDVLLEISRSEKKPIYYNMFVGKLNRLSTFPEEDRLEIVELATSNGWKNFYALNNDVKPSKKRFKDEAVSECYTEEEIANLKKLEEERKKNGLRTKF